MDQNLSYAACGLLIVAYAWARKEGKELVRAKDAAGITHYRLAAEASA